MVVGSGLIGSAFMNIYGQDPRVYLYAAGVSNSQCIEDAEYIRDKKMIEEKIARLKNGELLIYISTCSISTQNLRINFRYIEHKIEIEKMVMKYEKYFILRLPQIAGFSNNPFTLLNYFKDKINNGESFQVFKNSYRNILDVEDMALISEKVISKLSHNKIINIANPTSYSTHEIVQKMQEVLNRKAIYNCIDSIRDDYKIDITQMMGCIDPSSYDFNNKYLNRIIKKYYQ